MVSMKKLIFIFAFALLGTYFQSAQAQTFSRVVTVTKNIDTFSTYQGGGSYQNLDLQDTLLYQVPPGKIFKLEYATAQYSNRTSSTSNNIIFISINNVQIIGYPNYPATQNLGYINYQPSVFSSIMWLKAGDRITFPKTYYGGNPIKIQVFLSGIEYDAQ